MEDANISRLQMCQQFFDYAKAVLYTPPRIPSGLRVDSELSEDCPRIVRGLSELSE